MFSDHNRMKLKINNRRRVGKFTIMWKLNNILLKKKSKEEITEKIRKYFEMNGNEYTTYQNLWDTTKAMLAGRCIAVT